MKKPFIKLLFAAIFLTQFLTGCDHHNEPKPELVVKPAKGKVYVANEHEGSISVIDAATSSVIKTIVINADDPDLMAHNVQVAPDGKTVWVTGVPMTHRTPEQLVVIEAEADTIKHRIFMLQHYHLAHIVFDSASENAFVTATDESKVLKINTQTFQTVATFNLPPDSEPHGIRYSNGKLFVANLKGKSVSEIDVVSGQVTEIPTGGMTVQTAVTFDGKYVFATLYDTKEIVRYNLQTKTLERLSLPVGAQGPIQLYPSPDNKKVYVCDQGVLLGKPVSDKVFVIDTELLKVTNTITAGKGPHGVVFSSDGQHVFVTNTNAGTVSVIEAATEKVVNTIKVGYSPNGISYRSETGGMP